MEHKRIQTLLVEDNPGDSELMRIILAESKEPEYVIEVSRKLSQSLELLEEHTFDLIILDLNLPDSEGLETLASVTNAFPELPVVVLTGTTDEDLGIRAVQEGAEDFLVKGHISSQLLFRVLRYAIERKQSVIKLQDSESRLKTILDAIEHQILLMGTDHTILWPNLKTCEAAGLPREEIIGKLCYELWPDQAQTCEGCPVELSIVSKQPQMVSRWEKNGKIWDIHASPVFNLPGEIVSIVEQREDVSQEVSLEQQFRQAQKMEAVGKLAGGVAHDFNNMLSVILGFAEIAKNESKGNADLEECLDEITTAGKKSANLVRQLLAFSRKQPIKPQHLDCNEIISNSQKMLKRMVGEDIEIVFEPADNLSRVLLDPSQLDQIIANLAVNSRDAIAGIGTISIATSMAELDDDYCTRYSYARPGTYMLLSFSDTGCGMKKEVLEKVFEPFYTTKRLGEGTGLGMSTIFGIIKQNNGLINIYSEVGVGTTVKIYLPVAQKSDATASVKPEITSFYGTETILVVEDDSAILNLCRSMLTSFGYTVLANRNTENAIALTYESHKTIDLLLTDVIMPTMNGYELERKIKENRPKLKTIFMSGYPSDIIARRGVITEGVDFLQKPFTKNELGRIVREVLDRTDG